jgi:NADH:ubiquinone oxidoreductase subunit E
MNKILEMDTPTDMIITLNRIIDNYRNNGGNVISLLQETQDALGYIPREAVDYFSETLNIAPSRFYGVATFYSQFRLTPTGKNKITACCGTACHVRGAEKILNSVKRELKLTEEEDTTQDREFTVEKVACLGFCSFAPVVLINGKVFGKTTADPIVKEIKAIRKK